MMPIFGSELDKNDHQIKSSACRQFDLSKIIFYNILNRCRILENIINLSEVSYLLSLTLYRIHFQNYVIETYNASYFAVAIDKSQDFLSRRSSDRRLTIETTSYSAEISKASVILVSDRLSVNRKRYEQK